MTSRTRSNQAMEDLENAVIRQAESMGYEPGSDEFAEMVYERIAKPENRMLGHLRNKRQAVRMDLMVDSVDQKYVHYLLIKDLVHWSKLNKGMNITHAASILQIDIKRLHDLGEQSESFGFDNFVSLLDGTDDRVMSSMWPEQLDEGGSMTGHHQYES